MKKKLLIFNLLIALIFIVTSVSATAPFTSTLSEDYVYKNVTVRYVDCLDIADPDVSSVKILTTAGDGSDIEAVSVPTINSVTRTFTTTSGTFQNITVNINTGSMTNPVDWSSVSSFNIYIERTVPTLKFTVPGYEGTPTLVQVSDDMTKAQASDLSTFIDNSEPSFVYHPDRIMHVNIGQDQYRGYGAFDAGCYRTNDIGWTLDYNLVDVGSGFEADSSDSRGYADSYSGDIPQTGKYMACAFYQDNANKRNTILASFPVIILDKDYTATWTEQTNGDARVGFNTNPAGLQKVVWLLMNKSVNYSLDIKIDTTALVNDASSRWTNLPSSGAVTEIMYDMVRNDVGEGMGTYKFTASGGGVPSYANNWANIAISEGYGASGQMDGTYATIPKATLDALNTGSYYLYVMGLDSNYNIVGFDQTVKGIKKETINDPITANTPVTKDLGTVGDDPDTETGVTLTITTNADEGAGQTITVSVGSEPPAGGTSPPSGEKMIGKFLNIESSISNDNVSQIRIVATYTDAQVAAAGLDETKLRLYYWDPDSGTYKKTTNSGVDTVNNKVWGYVTHLSTFALITYTQTNGGGGGGGTGGGGGGGGGGFAGTFAVAGEVLTYTTTGLLDTNDAGEVQISVYVNSADGKTELRIPSGTTALGLNGKPISDVTIQAISYSSAPPAPTGPVIVFNDMFYQCEPAGAQFDPAITLIFQLTEEQYNSLGENQAFSVQYYDTATGEWIEVTTYVNPNTYWVIGEIPHFSVFGLMVREGTGVQATVTSTSTTAIATTTSETTSATPVGSTSSVWTWVLIIVVAVVLIGAVWWYYSNKK